MTKQIELTTDQIDALITIIDSYVRANGLQAAEPGLILARILGTAPDKKEPDDSTD